MPGTTGNLVASICGAWKGAARTSPALRFGFSVGAGVSDGTVLAIGMIGSGWINALVFGLANWLPGTQFWFVPRLVFDPELGGWFVFTDGPVGLGLGVSVCALALNPLLATSMPPAVSSPILMRSRRLVSPAAISSRRFLAASHISLKRRLETFSPNTLKYMSYLLLLSPA